MTDTQKNEIVALIHSEKQRLESYARVAKKCAVSDATISQMVNNNWDLIKDTMWAKVGQALGYRSQGWQVVETSTVRSVWAALDAAKSQSQFLGISHDAGVGKSTGLKAYEAQNRGASVFYLECREWAKKEFLLNLAQNLGIESPGSLSNDGLTLQIAAFFKARRASRPLLILDQANSLKNAALRTLIPIFNQCEDELAVVIAGTPHLEKMMLADARRDRPGGKELLSRFGRKLVHLVGATDRDVTEICRANGLGDAATIKKVFTECEPVNRMLGGRNTPVVEDLRRLKRCVQREMMRTARNDAPPCFQY